MLSSVSYFEDRRIFVGTLNLLRRETALSFPVSASVVTPANPTNLVLCLKNEKTKQKGYTVHLFLMSFYILLSYLLQLKLIIEAKNSFGYNN